MCCPHLASAWVITIVACVIHDGHIFLLRLHEKWTSWSNLRPCSLDFCSSDLFGSPSHFIYSPSISSHTLNITFGKIPPCSTLMPNFSSARGPPWPWPLPLPNLHPWGTVNLVSFPRIVISWPFRHPQIPHWCLCHLQKCRAIPNPTSIQDPSQETLSPRNNPPSSPQASLTGCVPISYIIRLIL